jgi:hypothetical protein
MVGNSEAVIGLAEVMWIRQRPLAGAEGELAARQEFLTCKITCEKFGFRVFPRSRAVLSNL